MVTKTKKARVNRTKKWKGEELRNAKSKKRLYVLMCLYFVITTRNNNCTHEELYYFSRSSRIF